MLTSARQMRKPTFSLGIKADRLVLALFGQRNPAIEMCLHMFALMAQNRSEMKVTPRRIGRLTLFLAFTCLGQLHDYTFVLAASCSHCFALKSRYPRTLETFQARDSSGAREGMMCNDTHQLPLFCFNQMTRYSDNSDPLSSLKNRKVYSTISDHIQRFTDVHSTFQSS